jgi:SRSO17 transposase
MAQRITKEEYNNQSSDYTKQELMKLNKLLQSQPPPEVSSETKSIKRKRNQLKSQSQNECEGEGEEIKITTIINPSNSFYNTPEDIDNTAISYYISKIEKLETKIEKLYESLKHSENHADDIESELAVYEKKGYYQRLELSNANVELHDLSTELLTCRNTLLKKDKIIEKLQFKEILLSVLVFILIISNICFMLF